MSKTYGLMRLGRDAEVRYTPAGDAVCNLSLVYNYGQKGEDGNRPSQWINATIWGKRAESLAPFMAKGSQHLFTLRDIHLETYTDKYDYDTPKLVATFDDVELGSTHKEGGGDHQEKSGEAPKRRPAGDKPPAKEPAPAKKKAPSFDDMDDDIPF